MAETTQVDLKKEIDEGILRTFLGVDDASDIDFGTYKTLLKEKIAAARMGGGDMDSGDVSYLTKEFVRIKKIPIPEGEEQDVKKKVEEVKKNRVDAAKLFNKTDETAKKSEDLKEKILESTKVSPSQSEQKVSPKLLLPPASPQEDEVEDEQQEFREEVSKGLNDLVPSLDNLQDTMENILGTLKKQMLLDKKEEREEDSLEAKQKRTGREDKLEGKGKKEKDNTKSMKDKVVKPVKGIFDMLMDFFKNILLGGALLFLINVLKDPQKYLQPFVDALNRVLEFFNGIIRAINGFIENFNKFVLGPINDFILKPIHSSLNYIEDRINDVLGLFGADPLNNIEDEPPSLAIPKIPEIPPYDPFDVLPQGATTQTPPPIQQSYQGGEVVHNEYVTNNNTTINRYEEGGNITSNNVGGGMTINSGNSFKMGSVNNKMGNVNLGGMTNNIGGANITGGNVTNNSGVNIKGAGPDTQLIAAQPGEIVMSRGAVSKFGADNLLAMNAAGGGNNTPRMTTNIQMANGGGTVINAQAFSGGGLVPGSVNKDTVPAMLTPGEIVMSRPAVENFGADTLLGMNAAAGSTNIPKVVEGVQYANQGGMVSLTSNGGRPIANKRMEKGKTYNFNDLMPHSHNPKSVTYHDGIKMGPGRDYGVGKMPDYMPTGPNGDIPTPQSGKILRAGDVGNGYGKSVVVDGPLGPMGFHHLSSIGSGIKQGNTVNKGKFVGVQGATGGNYAEHLHLNASKAGHEGFVNFITSGKPTTGGETSEETPKMSMNLERPDGMKQQHFQMFGSMTADHRAELAAATIGEKVDGLTVTQEIRAEVKRYNLALTKHTQMMAKNPQEDGGGSTASITSTGAARTAPPPPTPNNLIAQLGQQNDAIAPGATPTSSAAGGGKNVVPNFSSIDGMNTETLIIKSIYNMVG